MSIGKSCLCENLSDHNLHFIIESKLLEVFSDLQGINLSEKSVGISCFIELISDMSKIWAFYSNMLHSERVISTSMANRLVFLFNQITVRYSCVTDSESGHDRLLLTTEFSSCAAQTLLQVWKYLVKFVSGYHCSRVLAKLCDIYISILGFRSDQNTCECLAKLDVKAAFASPSALPFPKMPT